MVPQMTDAECCQELVAAMNTLSCVSYMGFQPSGLVK